MIILERFCEDMDLGTFGRMYLNGDFLCFAVEQPWRNNERFVSCVPVGLYELIPYTSPTFGPSLALYSEDLGVVVYQNEATDGERFACLFHAANWAIELQGCIAPGATLSWGAKPGHEPNMMVTSSRNMLEKITPKLQESDLLIRWKHEK